jgi:GAF domain-containing protein
MSAQQSENVGGLRNLLRLRYTYGNVLEQQQAQSLFRAAVVVIALALPGFLVYLLRATPGASTSVVIVNTVVSVDLAPISLIAASLNFLVLALLNRGNLRLASIAFVSGLLIFALMIGTLFGLSGPRAWTLLAFTLPLIAAGTLLRRQGVLFTLGLVVFSIAALNLFISVGLISYQDSGNAGTPLVFVVAVLAVNGALLYVFAGGQRVMLQSNLNLSGELNTLTSLSRTISTVDNLELLLTSTAETIRDQLGYYHVQVFLLEERTNIITLVAGTGLELNENQSAARRIALNSSSLITDVVLGGQTQRVLAESPTARRAEFLSATRSGLLVPLRRGERVIGVLDVQSVQNDAFNDEDVTALEAIAGQLSLAIQTARQAETLRQLNQDQEELVLQLRMASREIERLNQESSGRAWTSYIASRVDKAVGFDWAGGVLSVSTAAMPEPTSLDLVPRIEMRDGVQVLIVPITSRRQVLGLMEFRATTGQVWDDRGVELARAIAQRLALSLDNLRLFEQAQMAVAREQLANQVATLLQTRSDVDSLVSAAVDAFQQALGAIQTSIRLGVLDAPAPDSGRLVDAEVGALAAEAANARASVLSPEQPTTLGEHTK